jgi:hypothetical protein
MNKPHPSAEAPPAPHPRYIFSIYEKKAENELKGLYACMCLYMYTGIYAGVYVCNIRMCICLYMYTGMYTGVYVCNIRMCMYIYKGIYVGVYVCNVHMYIFRYICM